MLCIPVMPNTYAGCDFFTRTGEGFPLMTGAIVARGSIAWIKMYIVFETKIQSSAAVFSYPFCSFRKSVFDTQLPESLVLSIPCNPVNYLYPNNLYLFNFFRK